MNHKDDFHPKRLRWSGATALFVGAAFSIATAYVATEAGDTPVKLPFADRVEISVVAPEGWKFFTKDPQDERLESLLFTDGGWRFAAPGSNAEPSNFFGMSRDGRALGTEAGLLMDSLPSSAWKSCEGSPTTCLGGNVEAFRVRNKAPRPALCGSVGLVLQRPVPWQWARLKHPAVMPSRVARLEVQC